MVSITLEEASWLNQTMIKIAYLYNNNVKANLYKIVSDNDYFNSQKISLQTLALCI